MRVAILIFVLCCSTTITQAQRFSTETLYRYPLISQSTGEGGSFATDLSLDPARTVRYRMIDDHTLLISKNVSRYLLDETEVPVFIRMSLSEDGRFEYRHDEDAQAGSIYLHLRFEDDLIRGWESINYSLGDAAEQFILAPIEVADPRDQDVERCGTGAQIQLQLGDEIISRYYSDDAKLYEIMGEWTGVTIPVERVRIVAGPICLDNIAWWQVILLENTETTTWVAEADAYRSYHWHKTSSEPQATLPNCDTTFASRLRLGAYVHLTRPSPNSDMLDIQVGENLRIISDAECGENGLLWQVSAGDIQAWILEADAEGYLLEPSQNIELSPYLLSFHPNG